MSVLVWMFFFMSGVILVSCSANSKTYYINENNDTIAYLLNKDRSSKTAQIEVYMNYLLKRDSVHKYLYDYYKLEGYKTLISVHKEKGEETLYKFILNEESSLEAFYDMLFQVITAKRFYPQDSLILREILLTLQIEKCKVFKAHSDISDYYPEDYYAIFDENNLTIYEKDFEEDTLRMLDYIPLFIKSEYKSIDYSDKWKKERILEIAKKIRLLGKFAKECIDNEEYWESAQLAISALKRHQQSLFVKMRSKYVNNLKDELERYQIDKIEMKNDNPYLMPIGGEREFLNLYMSADVFINEKTCSKIFNSLKEELFTLGVNKVIFHWGVFSDESHIMEVSPKPLDDDEIGL